MQQTKTEVQASLQPEGTKREWSTPRLRTEGDVAGITLAISGIGGPPPNRG